MHATLICVIGHDMRAVRWRQIVRHPIGIFVNVPTTACSQRVYSHDSW